jgi:uncharacterized damage-inducible protein DinB
VDALDLLRDQTANADRTLRQVFGQVTPDQAVWRMSGSTANTIGATFMHVYYSEDQIVHGAQGAPTVFDSGGWQQRLGYDHDGVWTFTGRHDPGLLLQYADAVTAATADYLAGLPPEALAEEIETPRGRQPRARRLSVYLVNHKFQHTGEIAALLGCQGVKGLPF